MIWECSTLKIAQLKERSGLHTAVPKWIMIGALLIALNGCSQTPPADPSASSAGVPSQIQANEVQAAMPIDGPQIIDLMVGSTPVIFDIEKIKEPLEAAKLTTEMETPVLVNSIPQGYDVYIDGKKAVAGETIPVMITKISLNDGFDIKAVRLHDGQENTFRLRSYPISAPDFTIEMAPGVQNNGYYYFSTNGYLFKLSAAGDMVFYWNIGDFVYDFKRTEVGGEVFYSYAKSPSNNKCTWFVMDGNYEIIDQVNAMIPSDTLREGYLPDVHDFMILGKGHYMTTGYCEKTVYNIPDTVPHSAFGSRVFASVIQEMKDGQLVWQWDSTDYPELYGLSVINNDYFNSSTNWTETVWSDYMHFNSFTIDPADQNLICSFRNLSAIIKIDRNTGGIVWILGGRGDQFGLTEDQKFNLQHFARITADGTLSAFDNGNAKKEDGIYDQLEGVSRVVEYKLDEANRKLLDFKA